MKKRQWLVSMNEYNLLWIPIKMRINGDPQLFCFFILRCGQMVTFMQPLSLTVKLYYPLSGRVQIVYLPDSLV